MRKFVLDEGDEYSYDVTRIVKAFEYMNCEISRNDAKLAWKKYSDRMCAGWMRLPDSEREIRECIISFLREV